MLEGLIFTIGSLFFVILLLMVYFSKKRFLSIRNKLYRYMLVTEAILIVSEIVASFFLYYCNNEVLNLILHRFHWYTGIVWFSLLYYYSYCLFTNLKASNLNEVINLNSRMKKMTLIFLVSSVIYFFIPFERLDPLRISYIPGPAAYYILIFCTFVVLSIIKLMFENLDKLDKRKKISIWSLLVELIVVFSLQIAFPTVAISAIGAALQMFLLYFNIENPDLKVIRELESLKKDIERSSKAKSDFLSNMSHEIRSPMNAIVGFSETLLNEQEFDEKRAKTDIKHISIAGRNLLDIINNILDISKIESGKETLEKKEYSIANIAMELSSIIEARLGDKPVKLIVDVDESLPSKLYGDSTKIFQILLNILTNAVKYTDVGKIKFSVSGERSGEKIFLHFKVSDTGYGIKKEDYDKLFEKFSRLDSATSNEIEGTGLGLVITKNYVDLMGGRIWFDSEYDVGTNFYVDLTQEIIDDSKIGIITEPIKTEKQIEYINCSNYNVLIVDDNKLNIKVATRLLQPYKFNIESVTSGKECVYKFKEGKHYDMIFLDHMMPEMDGIETMHIIKKLDGYFIPPIVALTANAITGMKEMYLREGFDEYLSKPIDVSELNKLINKYFKKD